jgi:hypothetical protein
VSNLLKFLNFIFKDLYIIGKIFSNLLIYLKNLLTYDFYDLEDLDFDPEEKLVNDKEKIIFFNYGAKNVRELYKKSYFNKKSFIFVDLIWTKIFARKYIFKNTNYFRSNFRALSTKQGFYFNMLKLKNKKNFNMYLIQTFLIGLKYI